MNIPASPLAVFGVCLLSFLAFDAQSAAAQSTQAPTRSQESASPSPSKPVDPADQPKAQPKDSVDAQAKPEHPLSLRDRSWQILHGGLSFDNTDKRVKAVTALGVLKGNTEAEKLAIAALKDQKADVRAAAANALGVMHAVRAKDPLEVALDDNEPAVVLAAANSLMLLKEASYAYDVYYNVLTGTMRTNNGPLKEQIKEQLKILHSKKKLAELGVEQGVGFIPYGGLGYGMVKTLTKSDNSPMRAAAAKKLAHDPDPATATALVTATQDKNSVVRVAALEAIADRGDRSLIPKLAPSLDDDKDEVRYTGAACIARLSTLPSKRRPPADSVASAAVPN
jgi:HEAT repeat protein